MTTAPDTFSADLPVTLAMVEDAARLLDGAVLRTPLIEAPILSATLGCSLSLKLENLQHTSSFKVRGSFVKLQGLSEAERRRGVVAMSAGNHAQGVAYHAARLGIPATIVMPATTPFSKVERTRAHGARIVLEGRAVADCVARTQALIDEEGLVPVHPFDDPDIIRGQGTLGLEIDADAGHLDSVIVPIGGGGMMAGMAVALKALRPDVRMVGVQVDSFPSMYDAVKGLPNRAGGSTLAEGIAVKQPGVLTRRIIAELVDEIVLVPERAIERAVQLLVEQQRVVAEGAGAAGIAALLHAPERFAGEAVATVICGGNIDSRLLSSVLMRGLVRDGRLIRLRLEIHDEPGMLATVAETIGRTGGNIVEVLHQRMFQDTPIKNADLDVVVETRNPEHVDEILARFADLGIEARLLSTEAG
ncbi:threonine ammonia-lyase [Thalassobaculum sp.]|uniref:threonine ammonia-lyase n=1 Tax=Thalassobaculum sp. TaxID=2022740 RepID=UPI003B5A9AEC